MNRSFRKRKGSKFSILLERSMKFLTKSKWPVLLSWGILRCSRSTSGSFFLESTFQGHGMELWLLRRNFFDSIRVENRIRMMRSESVHTVVFIFDVGIFVLWNEERFKTYTFCKEAIFLLEKFWIITIVLAVWKR